MKFLSLIATYCCMMLITEAQARGGICSEKATGIRIQGQVAKYLEGVDLSECLRWFAQTPSARSISYDLDKDECYLNTLKKDDSDAQRLLMEGSSNIMYIECDG